MTDQVNIRPLLHASTKAIANLYNNRLSANLSSDQILKTIDHVIPKVDGAILGPEDLKIMEIKKPILSIKVELFTTLIFLHILIREYFLPSP